MTTPDNANDTAALSLRFKLFPSRRSNILATPCLTVQLNNVEIVRLLDPELGEGFVSGARLFVASGIPLLDALVRFKLHKPDYDVHLGKLAPFDDIWLPLSTTRDIANELGAGEELSRLLDPATRTAWSLDDGDEGGILHNWKIPQEYLAPSSYSADTMQSVDFERIALLQAGSQIRTPIDRPALQNIFSQKFAGQEAFFGSKPEHVLSICVSWLTLIYEQWCDETTNAAEELDSTTMTNVSRSYDLDATFLLRTLVSANIIAGTLPPTEERTVSLAYGELIIGKDDFHPIPSTAAKLAYVDLLSRLVLKYGGTSAEQDACITTAAAALEAVTPGLSPVDTSPNTEAKAEAASDIREELQELQKRVLVLEAAASRSEAIPSAPSRPRPTSRKQTQIEALASLHPATILLFMVISYILVQRVLSFLSSINQTTRVLQIAMRRLSGGSP